jgi:SAM-dependent methyltransferase
MKIKNDTSSQESAVMERNDWNQRYKGKGYIWTKKANVFLMDEAAKLPQGRALVLAAGEGRNAVWLAEQGWRVSAVDFSEVAIEKAKELAASREVIDKIDFYIADLHDYKPQERHFALVTLMYLQLPQDELAPIIAHAARAVAPGGNILIVGHDSENLKHGFGGPQNPDILYTSDQVVDALGNDIMIEKAGRFQRFVNTGDGQKAALDCLVLGRYPSS